MNFIPIDFIYPIRTIRLKRLTLSLVLVLAVVNLTILIQHPVRNTVLLVASLAIVGYLMAISLYQTYLSYRSTYEQLPKVFNVVIPQLDSWLSSSHKRGLRRLHFTAQLHQSDRAPVARASAT
jgi:hypothetical protein